MVDHPAQQQAPPRLCRARWWSATSRLRWVVDALWLLSFGAIVVYMAARSDGVSHLRGDIELSLVPGTQRRGLYREGRRLGGSVHRVARADSGWTVEQRFLTADDQQVGQASLGLRRDLSLQSIALTVDLAQLAQLTGFGHDLARELSIGALEVKGRCEVGSGECEVRGRLGKQDFQQVLSVGRGPVVPSAVYPLLARGVLGRHVDLHIFDPFSLSRRTVTYEVLGREALKLRGQRFDATLVRQDLTGLKTKLWLDDRGRVLKQQLPFGIWIEHESWDER